MAEGGRFRVFGIWLSVFGFRHTGESSKLKDNSSKLKAERVKFGEGMVRLWISD